MTSITLITLWNCLCYEEYSSLRFLMTHTSVVFGELQNVQHSKNKKVLYLKILDLRNIHYSDSIIVISFTSENLASINLTQQYYLIELFSESEEYYTNNVLGFDSVESYFQIKHIQKDWQIIQLLRSENDKKNLLAELTVQLIRDTIFRYDIARFILNSPHLDSLKLFWSELSKNLKQQIHQIVLSEQKLSKKDLPLLYLLNKEFHHSVIKKLKERIYQLIHQNQFDEDISAMMIGFIELSSRYDLLNYYYECMNNAYFDYSQGIILFNPIKMKAILTEFFYSIEKSI